MPFNNICPNCFSRSFEGTCSTCGYSDDNDIGDSSSLGRYTYIAKKYLLGRTIGNGRFGITYTALDIASGKRVAIKEYFPKGIATRMTPSTAINVSSQNSLIFRHGLRRFIDEAKTLSTLSDCAGIVKVDSFVEENNTAYLVMEYVEGHSLDAEAQKYGGRIPYKQAVGIFLSAAKALSCVHKKGLLHRDISPDNILLTTDGAVKIIDFASSRDFVSNNSRTVFVKRGFAPPEQYSNTGNQGRWTDIYALASTIYTVMSGVVVPDAASRLSGEPLAPINRFVPQIPKALVAVFEKALELNYSKRYQSMEELSADIMRAETSVSISFRSAVLEKRPYLKVIGGQLNGMVMEFEPDKHYVVGRVVNPNGILLPGGREISRVHMNIKYETVGNRFIISDAGSVNGLYTMEGVRLDPQTRYALPCGQQFYIASKNYPVEVNCR